MAALAIIAVFFVLMVLAFVYASRYKKVGPNQVLVISGRRRVIIDTATGGKVERTYRIVKGGGTFIVPVLERVDTLSMEIMTIDVVTPRVYTLQGVPVTVDGVAQIKIKSDEISIFTAAEQFLSKSADQIRSVALQTLEGHLRAILGTMTVEEIYKDRDTFAQKVQEVSAGDLANMGLGIVSFTIKDIRDDQGYLDALGQARTAEVKRDAAIGQAMAARDATIKSAEARQAGETAKFAAETKIAESQKSYQVQKAAYDAEVNQRKAESELAYILQQNKTNQSVKTEEVQIEVVQKQKQIEVQEQEVKRRVQELEATVRRPAEAEQFRIRTLADAKRFQTETEATGQAGATRSVGMAEADATKAKGLAGADVIRAQGLAEAEVIKAKGLSEAEVIKAQGMAQAEAMLRKAEAWQNYNQAAVVQQLVDGLPKVAEAIAAPLSKTEKIVIISNGGEGAGASKVTQDVTAILAQLPEAMEALTGVNLVETLKQLPGVQSTPTEPAA